MKGMKIRCLPEMPIPVESVCRRHIALVPSYP
nr:MAG TPA: hypothetical protein [Caudoviricetes sp.]